MNWGSDRGHGKRRIELNEYLDGLYGYAMVLSRNSTDAEDLVQETGLRALRGMQRLRTGESAKAWLFTILRNIWLNHLRHRRTTPEIVELNSPEGQANEPKDQSHDPHAEYINKMEREQVRFTIQKLPLEYREIIILREYEELSYQEIADLLSCPIGTVMSRLARARLRLRGVLAQCSQPLPLAWI